MRQEIDLRKIKQRIFMTFFEDGLWDIFLGIFLLGWGFTVWFDIPLLPTALFVAFFWLVLGLKRVIVYPRIGHATPVEQRIRNLKASIAGVVILIIVIVLLPVVAGGQVQFIHSYFEFTFGSMIAIVVAFIGYWWRIFRWYLYASLIFLFFVFNQWSGLSFNLSFIIPGGMIALCGLAILYRFISKYPPVPGKDNHANQY